MTYHPEEPSKDSTLDLARQLVEAGEARRQRQQPLQVTTGAGIAIAGAWIAAGALTITLLLIFFVFSPPSNAEMKQIEWYEAAIVLFLLASPMIAAYSITKVILSKD